MKNETIIPDRLRRHMYHEDSIRTWDDIAFQVNCDIFLDNFRKSIVIVNDGSFGCGEVFKNLSGEVVKI